MKKAILLVLALLLALSLFACKRQNEDTCEHDLVTHEGREATCTEDGWAEYVTCNLCDYTTYEVIEAKGHDMRMETISYATLTNAGKQIEICSVCNHKSGKTVIIPKLEVTNPHFSTDYVTVGQPLSYVVDGVPSSQLHYVWKVGGQTVSTTDSFTPTVDHLEKELTVKITDANNNSIAEDTLFCSKLPVLSIDTLNGASISSRDSYVSGTASMQGNSLYPKADMIYEGGLQIKGRGNSSWGFPKKSYRIKLDESADLFGFGKSKHWVLLANYIDETQLHNYLAFESSAATGAFSLKSTWVELIINGKHMGVYQLAQKIRADNDVIDIQTWETIAEDLAKAIYKQHKNEGFTLDMRDALEDQLVSNLNWITSGSVTYNGKTYTVSDYIIMPQKNGGFIIEWSRDNTSDASTFTTTNGILFSIKDPENIKSTNPELWNYIKGYLQAVEDALNSDDFTTTYQGKTVSYRDLVDLESMARFWLVSDFFSNEIGNKSTYLYMPLNGKLSFGVVWDFDYGCGGASGWAIQDIVGYHTSRGTSTKWFYEVLDDPEFAKAVYKEYPKFRAYMETTIADGGVIDSTYSYLKEALAVNEDMWKYKRGYEVDYIHLKYWVTRRLAWWNAQMTSEATLINSIVNGNWIATATDQYQDNPKTKKVGLRVYNAKNQEILYLDEVGNSSLKENYKTCAATDGSSSYRLSVKYSSTTAVRAEVYINGRLVLNKDIAKTESGGNKTVEFTINDSLLSTGLNEIRVWIRRGTDGSSTPYQSTVYLVK